MSRLYGDLLQGAGRRFYSDLIGAPGVVTPAPANLTLQGGIPAAAQPQTVFRTPAPATLTLFGRALNAPVVLTPAPASLLAQGQIPTEWRSLTITPQLASPKETEANDNRPTLITVWHCQPAPAQINLQALPFALSEGGNIGFVSPAPAQISLGTLGYTLVYGEIGAGLVTLIGREPTLRTELTVTPDAGLVVVDAQALRLSLPFRWVDDPPPPPLSWITDSAA